MAEPKRPRMRPAVVAALAAGVVAALAVATGAYSGWSPTSDGGDEEAPDLVLYNGKISPVDEDGSTVRAVAIRDGKILATGSSRRVRALARPSTIVVNLRGRRVLPGLIDGHLHGLRNGYHCFTQAVRLDNVTSRSAALAAYAAKADELADGRWILTTAGWTVRQLDQPGMLTLAELAAAARGVPGDLEAPRAQPAELREPCERIRDSDRHPRRLGAGGRCLPDRRSALDDRSSGRGQRGAHLRNARACGATGDRHDAV